MDGSTFAPSPLLRVDAVITIETVLMAIILALALPYIFGKPFAPVLYESVYGIPFQPVVGSLR